MTLNNTYEDEEVALETSAELLGLCLVDLVIPEQDVGQCHLAELVIQEFLENTK